MLPADQVKSHMVRHIFQ